MARKKDDNLHVERQQQIMEAAKQCFVTRGFHQSSMRQILEIAGISAGGAYNYFAGKADIVKGIVEEELADVDMLGRQLKSAKNPLIGVGQLVSDIIVYTTHENAVLGLVKERQWIYAMQLLEHMRLVFTSHLSFPRTNVFFWSTCLTFDFIVLPHFSNLVEAFE